MSGFSTISSPSKSQNVTDTQWSQRRVHHILSEYTVTVPSDSSESSQVAGNDALEPSNLISVFEEPLTAILTSRFLINLQKVKRRVEDSSRSLSKVSEIAFQPYHSGTADGPIESSRIQQLSHEDDTENGTGDDVEELP
ncbi:hypothetical protein BD309DRAFT_1020105 [Dichomitus squalens]|uniref:uncharacterized protein n=1 Tax=Dichomitus squalens (strain LYAD-421) TaxID=732165 RepID=UPI0004414C4C|nr:uncharacterized protein DICSQDRAFT_167658 [Dichomitus squalens LYAD-421 SS1]EJF63600.1 hypothetical protein DICSQDRAFT_167658 [Dichomitus squalens LYAD-421 SS1]TBU42303.1 hypothetical protein BD309DRAFT_1020105 [Dichomitus squalens]